MMPFRAMFYFCTSWNHKMSGFQVHWQTQNEDNFINLSLKFFCDLPKSKYLIYFGSAKFREFQVDCEISYLRNCSAFGVREVCLLIRIWFRCYCILVSRKETIFVNKCETYFKWIEKLGFIKFFLSHVVKST